MRKKHEIDFVTLKERIDIRLGGTVKAPRGLVISRKQCGLSIDGQFLVVSMDGFVSLVPLTNVASIALLPEVDSVEETN